MLNRGLTEKFLNQTLMDFDAWLKEYITKPSIRFIENDKRNH